ISAAIANGVSGADQRVSRVVFAGDRGSGCGSGLDYSRGDESCGGGGSGIRAWRIDDDRAGSGNSFGDHDADDSEVEFDLWISIQYRRGDCRALGGGGKRGGS